MFTRFKKDCLHLAVAAALTAATPAFAQNTSSGISGQLTDSAGQVIEQAKITIVHTPSNSTKVITSNANGRFSAKGLRVGGPYTVTVESAAGKRVVEDVYLTLGENYTLDVDVVSQTLEEVFIVGNYQEQSTATGPSSSFNISDLENTPAVNRDIKDIVRIDPRIYIDRANADEVQCGGANPRFNSLTVDGVRMNDNFGLNGNGYPTERLPFPFAAIDQVAVELAPFDVQYGGFTACNINAVTKSGDNEVHGSIFYNYQSDALTGDSLEGDSINLGSFDEHNYGFTIGGPIVKDKLFYFVAYDYFDGVQLFDRGPAGSGAPREVQGVSQAQLDEILDISRNASLYDYDPGGLPSSLPVDDTKLLVKVDWNISDDQRLAVTYNYNDGFVIAESDDDADELELSNHYYERGSELRNYVGQLFSNWNDNFSTEIKLGYSELDNRQLSLGGTDFGEVQITTRHDHDNDGNLSRATVYLGADDSRHANKLKYDTFTFKAAGTYLQGNHTLTFGLEYEIFDVFNLFIQEAEGEYRFSSIDDFRSGMASRIIYENAAGTNNKSDAAAEFGYKVRTYYVQDEYAFDSIDLKLVAGLRYEQYRSSDNPAFNPDFTEAYGFSNQANTDKLDLWQPRLGFEWQVNDALEVHGGAGRYSGGNPNVWLSNNYSNDGVTQVEASDRPTTSLFDMAFSGDAAGRPIYGVPTYLYNQVAERDGRLGRVNLLDPNFEIPSSWKYALGASYAFENEIVVTADLLYSDAKDAAIISDISRVADGVAPDGRNIYESFEGREQDFMLTNVQGDSGSSSVLSLGISKSFDSGLDIAFGYAYTQAEDVNPMTSSVAFSNYANLATADPENPGVQTSNYEIPHRFTLKVDYTKAFFGNYETTFSLFGSANEGRPYSYTFADFDRGDEFENNMFGDSTNFVSRHLLYVPTDANDPDVIFGENFNTAEFFAWADAQGLARGQIMDRNSLQSDWWTKFDVRIEQEMPGFVEGHTSSAYLVISNIGNLLNDDWGVQRETDFPRAQSAVEAYINEDGNYVFESFLDPAGQTRTTEASLWEMRIGVEYKF